MEKTTGVHDRLLLEEVRVKRSLCGGATAALLVGLVVSTGSFAGDATAADPVTLSVYDPTGSVQVSQLFAPRVDTLAGKTICELTDSMWESSRTFPVITDLLKKRFSTATVIDHTRWAFTERDSVADLQKVAASVKAAGCQAAIVGNAG